MELIWNKSGLRRDLNKKALTLISETTLNVSSKLPYMDISISPNDKVFIWGDVYLSSSIKLDQSSIISLIKEKIGNIVKTQDASNINTDAYLGFWRFAAPAFLRPLLSDCDSIQSPT